MRASCAAAPSSPQDDKYGLLDVKPLGSVWGQHPQWGPHNTVMFDDLSRNFLMNPQSGLKIRPCRGMTIEAHIFRPILFTYLLFLTNQQPCSVQTAPTDGPFFLMHHPCYLL